MDIPTLEKWLRGPRLKLQRAIRHIDELDREIEAFFSRRPYRIAIEPNQGESASRWPLSLFVRVSEEVPEAFSLIIGDAIHNLRSSLDLIVCAMVRANGGKDNRAQFPIAYDESQMESLIKKHRLDQATPSDLQFIRGLKPYKEGGDETLWAIHRLDILDKHRLVIAVAGIAHFKEPVIGTWFGTSTVLTMPGYQWGNLYDGRKLLDIRAEPEFKVGNEIETAFSIAFADGQPAARRPVLAELRRFSRRIDQVLSSVIVKEKT